MKSFYTPRGKDHDVALQSVMMLEGEDGNSAPSGTGVIAWVHEMLAKYDPRPPRFSLLSTDDVSESLIH